MRLFFVGCMFLVSLMFAPFMQEPRTKFVPWPESAKIDEPLSSGEVEMVLDEPPTMESQHKRYGTYVSFEDCESHDFNEMMRQPDIHQKVFEYTYDAKTGNCTMLVTQITCHNKDHSFLMTDEAGELHCLEFVPKYKEQQ